MKDKLAALSRLSSIVDALRGPGGCPWDKAQKLSDVGRYFLEESSEVTDALDVSGGEATPHVCEELGDVLMNVFLAARIAEDSGSFDLADVGEKISDKLVRRHPHVFGETKAESVEEVLTNWNAIKLAERDASGEARPVSRLDGVPRSLPPLERAYELGRKAAKAGFDWPDADGALRKVEEELDETRSALRGEGAAGPLRVEEELGDLLFAVVNLCRKLELRPDSALRRALRKFDARFRHIEARLPQLEKASLDEMESHWRDAKRELGSTPT